MKVIKTPWKEDLLELVSNTTNSIEITSPFIKKDICNDLLLRKHRKAKVELITSFKLKNIYSGSLDLAGLENILNDNGKVKNFSKLHSKIYLFDKKKAIITSGNLTSSGLLRNFEYGIFVEEKNIISQISDDFYRLSSNEDTGNVSLTHISEVKKLLAKIPKQTSVKLPKYDLNQSEKDNDYNEVLEVDKSIIESSLKGWKLEVFKCINNISSQEFSLNEINKYEDYLKKKYPNNQHITAKIRQQLQNLRDLGLIEFLGNGKYKKLWK